MKKLPLVIGCLFFIGIMSFWLYPTNGDSPLVRSLQTVNGEKSIFGSDIFGNVYYRSDCGELCGSINVRIPGVRASGFTALSFFFGKTESTVYYGKSFGGNMSDLSDVDAFSFEILSERSFKDKNNVYYFPGRNHYNVWGVKDTSGFVLITDHPDHKVKNSAWFKDSNHVYYNGFIIKYADPATFELIKPENEKGRYTKGRDKNYTFDVSEMTNDFVDECKSENDCTRDVRMQSASVDPVELDIPVSRIGNTIGFTGINLQGKEVIKAEPHLQSFKWSVAEGLEGCNFLVKLTNSSEEHTLQDGVLHDYDNLVNIHNDTIYNPGELGLSGKYNLTFLVSCTKDHVYFGEYEEKIVVTYVQ